MNLILNRLEFFDRRRQQKARICDRVDSLAPSRVSVGKEIDGMTLKTQLLDSFV